MALATSLACRGVARWVARTVIRPVERLLKVTRKAPREPFLCTVTFLAASLRPWR